MFFNFLSCFVCRGGTDLRCCVCERKFCENHLVRCVDCFEMVCDECFEELDCCESSRKGKTERYILDFYAKKDLVTFGGFSILERQNSKRWNERRQKVAERSALYYCDNMDPSFLTADSTGLASHMFGRAFPKISRYTADEERRWKFVEFLKSLTKHAVFSTILLYSSDRDEMLSLMQDFLRQSENLTCLKTLICISVTNSAGKSLFRSLEKYGLLDFDIYATQSDCPANHLDAFKWIEQNVGTEKLDLKRYADLDSVEIVEYLLSKKKQNFVDEYLLDISCHIVQMMLEISGIEVVQKVEIRRIVFDYKTVKVLKHHGYVFNKKKVKRKKNGFEVYALLCFDILKFSELCEKAKQELRKYALRHDIKFCNAMFPFMKLKRQRKIITFILCVKRLYGKNMPKGE